MFTQSKKQYEDDDGRVICNMNVEGMPWYEKSMRIKERQVQKPIFSEQMTRSEVRSYTWSAILAGLLIVAVFSVTWILFVLLCIHIWFR